MPKSFTEPFSQLSKNDAPIAGGKGASLGEMTQAGIPVPPGFVVLSSSFEQFIKETGLAQEIDAILYKMDNKEIRTVEAASEKIRRLILNAEMPQDIADEVIQSFKELNTKYVAVRSSATVEDGKNNTWAGQLESYLNIEEGGVLTKVKLCWSSLFTPRAIFYRFKQKLDSTKISVAVVVQKMVESEVSGIAFSVHPVTKDRNQLIIEAGFGLGEAIVSGPVTPDSYVVQKEPRNILDTNVSTQARALYRSNHFTLEYGNNEWRDLPKNKAEAQVLSSQQILELANLILKIEQYYGFPCDIEWAFEKNTFYIVQSRPITAISNAVGGRIAKILKYLASVFVSRKLVLEKTITRDWPLFIAEMLHRGFIAEFKKQFGFGYTEVLFNFHDNQLDVYRAAKEHVDGLRDFVLSNLKTNPKFLSQQSFEIRILYERLMEKIEYIKNSNLPDLKNQELLSLIESFIDLHSKIEPRFVINFWFPILMEKYSGGDKWESEIMIAANMRAETEKVGPEGDIAARKLSGEVISRMGLENGLAKFISLSEAREFLLSGKRVDESLLIKRKNQGFIFGALGILFTDAGSYAEKEGYKVVEQKIETGDEIRGTCACTGFARGIVRIIKSKTDIDQLREGEILVTAMTTPEFLPAMIKSRAFITDEGGITCHAAIVARELKKPCIIGTKIATKVLKDGDLVEVDADNGVVRTIN